MEIRGIPLHPLVVHAVVVFGPLAALTGLIHALVPRWRWATRWPLLILALVAAGSAVLAAASGSSLLNSRQGLSTLASVKHHQSAGLQARNVMLVFLVAAIAGFARLGGPTPLVSGRGKRQHGGAVDLVVSGLVILASLAALAVIVRAGDSGAHAVWGG